MKNNIASAREAVDRMVDGLGMPVDAGIKDMVAALVACGIPTSGSCEGHLDHGLPYPWVDINSPYPPNLEPTPPMIAQLQAANAPIRNKVTDMLSEFYKGRSVDSAVRLHLRNLGVYGAFRLQSVGLSRKDAAMLVQYQTEMDRFARFAIDSTK